MIDLISCVLDIFASLARHLTYLSFCVQLPDRTFLDPQKFGGVLVRANAKHGSAVNTSVIVGIDDRRAWMLPLCTLSPGEELFWFYASKGSTKTPCQCKGAAVSVGIYWLGARVDLPKCCGYLYL
jgi:hypothetical protein